MSTFSQLVGTVLDEKYRIEKQLGAGGMGAVYLATHLHTKRPVALKVIIPQLSNEEFIERFKREAEAAGRLQHPNVVNVTDFGFASINESKVAYLVMEYLKGRTLGDLMKEKGKLPLGLVVDIVEQICLAMDEAHKQGIIHRDLKPDNIWLEPNGRGGFNVKVLDFGLAKLRKSTSVSAEKVLGDGGDIGNLPTVVNSSNEESAISLVTLQPTGIELEAATQIKTLAGKGTTKPNLTDTVGSREPTSTVQAITNVGAILGTPLYMSPEQCGGEALDARSDIYSLGIIVYQMLAGETPFSGSLFTLIVKHCQEEPPSLQDKRKEIPKGIVKLIMSALAKKASERPPTSQAFAKSLRINFEGDVVILDKALEIFRKSFFTSISISFIIYIPFILINCLVSYILLQSQHIHLPYTQVIQFLLWFFPFLLVVISNDLSTLAFALVVQQHDSFFSEPLQAKPIFVKIKYHLRAFCITSFHCYLAVFLRLFKFIIPGLRTHTDHLFYPPIVIIEGRCNWNALERSKTLVEHGRTLAFLIQARGIVIGFATFFLLYLSSFFAELINPSQFRVYGLIVLLIILPGLFTIIVYPYIAIAISILYFRIREANGESFNDKIYKDVELFEIKDHFRVLQKRMVGLIILLSIMSIFCASSYVLFIPPPFNKTKLPNIKKIPDHENAWIEYQKACLLKSIMTNSITFKPSIDIYKENEEKLLRLGWEKQGEALKEIYKNKYRIASPLDAVYGFGGSELSDEQKVFLDNKVVTEVINHILAGTKKTGIQYYTEPPFQAQTPSFIDIKDLAYLLTAKARRLELDNHFNEALQLDLMAYHMGTDITLEPQATIFSMFISIVCRSVASGALIHWLNQDKSDTNTYLDVARKVADLDERMPDLLRIIENEKQLALWQTSEERKDFFYYKFDETSFAQTIKLFPGLQQRITNAYLNYSTECLENIELNLQRSDLENLIEVEQKLIEVEEENRKKFKNLYWPPFAGDIVVKLIVSGDPFIKPSENLKIIYFDQANGAAIQLLAACLAYKHIHGNFPENIEKAMAELGLKRPIDPATKQPVSYRIENGVPIIWLAGVDGKDDGGLNAYNRTNRDKSIPGYDLIYRLGEMPDWYK